MNAWQTFLINAGAVVEDGQARHFGDPAGERRAAIGGTVLADLSPLGLIRVSGEDAQSFLQGQFTNDVRAVDAEHSQLSAYCTAKGRMLACFRLFLRDGDYYLRLPRALTKPVIKRLRMYVLRAKVSVENASEDLITIGYSGPRADETLRTAAGAVPDEINGAVRHEAFTIIRLPGPHPRFEISAPPADITILWTRLAPQAVRAGVDAWELLDIRSGLPTIYSETVEAFVPQMANLDLLNGISFKKGCYTGQEIVARTHYLGKVKKRLYHLRGGGDIPPRPGDDLFDPAARDTQSVGMIVRAQPSPDGGYEALAVVETASREQGAVRLREVTGPVVAFVE